MKTTLCFSFCLLICWSCSNPALPDIYFDQPFSLQIGKSAYLPQMRTRLALVDVMFDWRCPPEAFCQQAGLARLKVAMIKAEFPDSLVLFPEIKGHVTAADTSRHISIDTLGLSLTLLQLDPQPGEHLPSKSEYVATFLLKAYP